MSLDVDRDVAISRPRFFLFSILTSFVLTRRERKKNNKFRKVFWFFKKTEFKKSDSKESEVNNL